MILSLSVQHIENHTYPMSQESDSRAHFFFHGSEGFELFDLGFYLFPRFDVRLRSFFFFFAFFFSSCCACFDDLLQNIYADVFAFGLSFVTILRFLVTKNRFIVLKRYVLILGTVFLFRALTIISTILPQPQKECFATATGNAFLDALLIILLQKKTCTDLFFSGHATNLTFAALLWTYYSHMYPVIPLSPVDKFLFRGKPLMDKYGRLKRPTLVKILVWIVAILGYFFVNATRLQYVIDIIFGFFVSTIFFVVCFLLFYLFIYLFFIHVLVVFCFTVVSPCSCHGMG